MALGKPLVVTDAPGVRDYVSPEETGIVVPPRDVQAMRSALVRVMDPAQRERLTAMRSRARDVAMRQYSPARYWETLREVAERVAAPRRR
jgi:glycosyltransferase involved in cell wall biosynthesis